MRLGAMRQWGRCYFGEVFISIQRRGPMGPTEGSDVLHLVCLAMPIFFLSMVSVNFPWENPGAHEFCEHRNRAICLDLELRKGKTPCAW